MRRTLILFAIGIILVVGGIYFIARAGDHGPTVGPASSGHERRIVSVGESGVTIEPRLNGLPHAIAVTVAIPSHPSAATSLKNSKVAR